MKEREKQKKLFFSVVFIGFLPLLLLALLGRSPLYKHKHTRIEQASDIVSTLFRWLIGGYPCMDPAVAIKMRLFE